MTANQINSERLRKVLALVDSDKEGEALAAFQMAKRLLAKGGMSFREIIDIDLEPQATAPKNDASRLIWDVIMLRQRISALLAEIEQKSRSLRDHENAVIDLAGQVLTLHDSLYRKPYKEEFAPR
ncbi:MAG: hypothetical protein IH994_08325 [Proteobacteria bacterium]|nr:hypothetical protein [Pseudomonadota bacterium]